LACTCPLTNEAVDPTNTQFGVTNHELVSRVFGKGIVQRESALAQCADWINPLAGDGDPSLDVVSGGTTFEIDIPSELSSVSRAGDHSRLLFSIVHSAANNLLSESQASEMLAAVLQNSNRSILHALIAGQSPATKAIARTFLPGAIKSLDCSLVKALLNTGISPDTYTDDLRRRPLQIAISIESMEMTKLLLERGADVGLQFLVPYGHANTPMKAAVETGRIDLVQLLLRVGAQVNDLEPRPEMSALQIAARSRNLGLIQLLLDAGADVNAPPNPYCAGTALEEAASAGDIEVVQLLLSYGADVNSPHEEYRPTALVYAALSGNADITQLLLFHGATDATSALKRAGRSASVVNLLIRFWTTTHALLDDAFGRTALRAATECGDFGLVQMLLERKVSADAPCTGAGTLGNTALQIAAWCGEVKIAELLMSYGADVNAQADYSGRTALQAALSMNHIQLVRIRLDRGADINAPAPHRAHWGGTAIAAAVSGGDSEMVQLFLDRGADLNMHDLTEIVKHVSLETLRSLLEAWTLASGSKLDWTLDKKSSSAFDIAAEILDAEKVRLLLEYVEYAADELSSALRVVIRGILYNGGCATSTHIEILETLLASGAGVGYLYGDKFGENDDEEISTALENAARIGALPILRLLLEHGKGPTAHEKCQALQVAAQEGLLDAARLLLDHGADVNAPPLSFSGGELRTALQAAAGNGDLKMVRFFLEVGATVESTVTSEDEQGTALQFATIAGSMSVVTLLIQNGANVHAAAMGDDGRTALEGAAEHGRLDIVQLFLSLGTEVAGSRAIEFAKQEGHDGVVALLEESA